MGRPAVVELRHLRYFAAVAAQGGVGRAAGVLHLAQPALSRQIKDLEEELGVALLTRTPKGVATTSAGAAFLAGATQTLEALREALEATRLAAAGVSGRCVIGIGPIAMSREQISGPLARLVDLLPGIEVSMRDVHAVQQPLLIASGELDVGFCLTIAADDPVLASELWTIEDFCCALLSAEHPLARRAELEPGDLADIPMAFLSDSRAPEAAELARRALDRAGIRSPREFIYASPHSAIMMVAAGRCWGPSPRSTRPPEGLAVVPVRGFSIPIRLDLAWRRDERRATVRRVLDTLRALRDDQAPAGEAAPAPHSALPPGLELRHLRYFAAVAADGSFGRAAERLGVTQPSLSRQVADLEYLLRAQLLERTPRGVVATDAGLALRDRVRRVEAAIDDMIGVTHQARRGVAGRCVIGSVQTLQTGRLVAGLSRACTERWPRIEVFFENHATPHQPDALREGLIDVGVCHAFASPPHDGELAHERLVDDPIECALLGEQHPLAGRPALAAAELVDVPLLFLPREFHPVFFDRVTGALRALGLAPRIDATYESLGAVWALAAEGRGWAVGFRSHARRAPAGLRAIPVEGLHLAFGLDLLWRRREVNPAVAKVLDLIREWRAALVAPDGNAAARVRRSRAATRRSATPR